MKDPILEPVMKRRTEKRLPTLDGARCHGPGVGVPGVLRPDTSDGADCADCDCLDTSDCLGLLLLGRFFFVCFSDGRRWRGAGAQGA